MLCDDVISIVNEFTGTPLLNINKEFKYIQLYAYVWVHYASNNCDNKYVLTWSPKKALNIIKKDKMINVYSYQGLGYNNHQ